MYAKLFPNQYVSLSHGEGVPINAEGEHDPNQPSRNITEVVGEALSTLGAQFVFQSSALTGNSHHGGIHSDGDELQRAHCHRFSTGDSCERRPNEDGRRGKPATCFDPIN